MDIKDFLQQSAGKWFAQRTTYKLSDPTPENSKAEFSLELLSGEDSVVVELCQQHSISSPSNATGIKSSWDNSVDWGQDKKIGSTVIALIPNANAPHSGQLLRESHAGDKVPAKGHYILNNDDSLTLILEGESFYSEERLWFASENLRLRTTLVKNAHGITQTSFYSEIRKIPPKPQE